MWKFRPVLKPTLWGGHRIATFKAVAGEVLSPEPIGESWELSALPCMESVVTEGPDLGATLPELIAMHGENVVGKKNYQRFGGKFPILIKIIDAAMDLSVQVHPDDAVARRHGGEGGKTEMWVVLEADRDSELLCGLDRPLPRPRAGETLDVALLMSSLHREHPQPGDSYLIPAGRIHSIGRGLLLAEIQQSADITYRINDYGRRDAEGHLRELHTDLAAEAINYTDLPGRPLEYTAIENIPVNLVATPYFTVNMLAASAPLMRDYSEWDTFVAIVCVEGEAELTSAINSVTIGKGDTVLVPAVSRGLTIRPSGSFRALEVYLK